MVNPYNINEDVVRQYVKDVMDGKNPQSPFPAGVEIPKIPTKEELDQKIKEKVPSDSKLDAMASKKIIGKIPNVPFVHFIPPTPRFNTKTNILIDPFINAAKIHLMSRGGTMMVMAQYPPPAPPAPGILMWQGYNVRGGPPVPPMLPKYKIPTGLNKFLSPEKGAKKPEDVQKEIEDKLNPPQPIIVGNTILPGPGVVINVIGGVNPAAASNTTPISVTGGQTITDKTITQNNINKNKC